MRRSVRVGLFVALAVVCVAVPAGAVLRAGRDKHRFSAEAIDGGAPLAAAVATGPHVLFRDLKPGANGRVVLAQVDGKGTARNVAPTGLECLRVYMAGGQGLCLNDQGSIFGPYQATFFGPDFRPGASVALAGVISRARVSPDGRYGTATVFVTGDSYAPGKFSTRTTLFDMAGQRLIADLEQFSAYRDGKRLEAPDLNYWGVTFTRDSNVFYATLATGSHTYLVKGDVAARRADVLRDGVECPSVSPDGTRLAFKQRVGGDDGGPVWRPAVLDLATLTDHQMAEERGIDDQIEWLDDQTLLYAVDTGDGAPSTWAVPADGSGLPKLFIKAGDSPSVAR